VTHFIGTSLICQAAPKSLALGGKLDRLLAHLNERAEGHVKVVLPKNPVVTEGWRPQPSEAVGPQAALIGGEIYIRPQYASGWRLHLSVWDDFWRLVRLAVG
jgi:hypothetical protein